MNINKNILIGGIGIALVVIAIIVFFIVRGGDSLANQEVSTEAPVDITLNFYEAWLAAVQSTSTDPYKEDLVQEPLLSKDLRKRLKDSKNRSDTDVDPVLCETGAPTKVAALPVYERDDSAQIVVLPRDEGRTAQSIFTLLRHNDGWYISDIECAPGEFAPEREFTFEEDGFLLKSVPPPLDPNYWYVTFEQGGEMGHVAKLIFDTESMCVGADGNETVCDPNQFVEPSKIYIQGQMTEVGVEVKRMTHKEE